MTNNEIKNIFLEKLSETFGNDVFSIREAESLFVELKLGKIKSSSGSFTSEWTYVHKNVLVTNKTEKRGKYWVGSNHPSTA